MRKIAIAITALLCFSACNQSTTTDFRAIFREKGDICFVVGPKNMIDFSSGNIQSEFNKGKMTYKAGVGNIQYDPSANKQVEIVEEYYVVVLDKEANSKVDETYTANVLLCSAALSRTYSANFTTIRADEDKIWLWDDALKLGIVVRIAN